MGWDIDRHVRNVIGEGLEPIVVGVFWQRMRRMERRNVFRLSDTLIKQLQFAILWAPCAEYKSNV